MSRPRPSTVRWLILAAVLMLWEGLPQGGFIPELLRSAPVDGEVKVTGAEALAMARRLNREFGLLVGTSSGANAFAALKVAGELGPSGRVVTLLCDRAERYFSTALFDADQ